METTEPKARFDVFQTVTDKIIQRLEAGVVPWQSPSIARVGLPRNYLTKRPYNGINVFLLASSEYQSPHFMTFIQAKELGGHVRKGEHGMPVIKYGIYDKDKGATARESQLQGEQKTARYLRMYTVFNACQIDGVQFPDPPKCETFTEHAQADNARKIIAAMPNPPKISEGRHAKPCYNPTTDAIELPDRATFRAEWRFYKTLFHELAHATGHGSRLNRPTLTHHNGYGARNYCLEELVAEMTAAFLAAHAGIVEDNFENSAAYLAGWLEVLKVKENKGWIIKAAADAQKAANHILGITTQPQPQPEPEPENNQQPTLAGF